MTDEKYQEYREDILQWIKSRLKPKRFHHTLGVEETAIILARTYGYDYKEASLAALLHDNAKNLEQEELYKICQKHFPEYNLTAEYATVFHAFAGSITAKEKYPELSNEILSSICFHTTGRPEMTLQEKIIYAADYAEPGRDSFPGLELIREQVFQNLDAGIRLMLQQTIDYVKMKKKNIHPLTLTTLEYFNEEIQNH